MENLFVMGQVSGSAYDTIKKINTSEVTNGEVWSSIGKTIDENIWLMVLVTVITWASLAVLLFQRHGLQVSIVGSTVVMVLAYIVVVGISYLVTMDALDNKKQEDILLQEMIVEVGVESGKVLSSEEGKYEMVLGDNLYSVRVVSGEILYEKIKSVNKVKKIN